MTSSQYSNARGQEVGYIENGAYVTIRDAKKGEIFLYKRYFNGRLIENPIAIDKGILDRLVKLDIEWMKVFVRGVKEHTFTKFIKLQTIKDRGQLINYDKRNLEGRNITGWGTQLVFSLDWGTDEKQQTL